MNAPRAVVHGVVIASMVLVAPSMADVWDLATANDDSSLNATNTVSHGGVQVHDLGVRPGPVADEDWYRAFSYGYSSYEVVVDGMTGDVNPPVGISLERVDSTGAVLTSSLPILGGPARSVRWENTTAAPVSDSYIRVRGALCGTDCSAEDQYTIRFYDTTYSVPRFNNSGSQVTILILQNTSPQTFISGNAYCWSSSGTLLATIPISLGDHQILVSNTAAVPGLQGVGGSITITTDGRYGQLTGKAIALEPATGFSFDSPMVPLPL
jgi:hypothetical protein